jgi:hypothetical protein
LSVSWIKAIVLGGGLMSFVISQSSKLEILQKRTRLAALIFDFSPFGAFFLLILDFVNLKA